MKLKILFESFRFIVSSNVELNKHIFDSYFVSSDNNACNNEIMITYKGFSESEIILSVTSKKMQNFMGTIYDVYTYNNGYVDFVYSDNSEGSYKYRKISDNEFEVYALSKIIDNKEKWIIRLIREIMLEHFVGKGFIPMHASAVSCPNGGVMFVGNKGRGKSTSMMSCVGKNCNIISNDLVFLGLENNKIVIKGWPLCITIGNSLLKETNKRERICTLQPKTRFLPKEFCDIWGIDWCCDNKLNKIIFPQVQPGRPLEVNSLLGEEILELLNKEGSEFDYIPLLFRLESIKGNFIKNYMIIKDRINCYRICGDFWKYRNEYRNLVFD